MSHCKTLALLFLASLAMVSNANGQPSNDQSINFAKQILPILSDKCFVCHGPDSENVATLRLDSFDAATADLGGYAAIDLETPSDSALVQRIFSADDPMPPADAEKQLSESERELLRAWVEQGGEYARHWAFVPPTKPPTPQLDSHDAIDAFVLEQLQQRQLDFAPAADRRTLARRVALTLTGLPPEPAQLARFLSDDSEQSYERLVEELLASPRFGEHFARYWLDAVRYGDTHGLHLDNRRGIYPYRDWVVRAFNENLPLDQFITWQLAGDLLPNPTLEQKIATGYVRLNPSTGEGGAIADEFQAKNNFDRVETFGTVFLGMSLTCARCHTHKYDPIPQTEYYRLMAFFNNTSEPALDGNSYTYGATVRTPADQTAWHQWLELSRQRDGLLGEVASQLTEDMRASCVRFAKERSEWSADNWRIAGPLNENPVDEDPVDEDPVDENPADENPADENPADEKLKSPAEDAWKSNDRLPGTLSGKNARGLLPTEGQAVWVSFTIVAPAQQSLWVTYSGGAGTELWLNEHLVATKDSDEGNAVSIVPVDAGSSEFRIKLAGRSNTQEIVANVRNPWDAIAKAEAWDECDSLEQLQMLADPLGPVSTLLPGNRAQELSEQLTVAAENFTTTLVAQELPQPRETRVLKRGEYDLPQGDPLEPGILEVASAFPADAPRNRLGLAQWLTSRDQPLVSRVLINRIWQQIFGFGLVRTPEDFGLQGQQPTHPELLDWLAVELQECGWDLKEMIRMMVMSKTYRQNSGWRSDVDDPENRLFARGPSYRLDAEVLRDLALWSSGMLDPHMGGEGVKPYQPDGMWMALAHPASNTKSYEADIGQRLYRRSLYVYWKRTSPHPMMTLFDAPDRESSCVRRSRTNTPLQSLGLLNETQRIEMARSLAERLLLDSDDNANRLDGLFNLLACRIPTPSERSACETLLSQLSERYQHSPADAEALVSIGQSSRNLDLDPVEYAAWTQLSVTILASDVAILLY